MPSKKILTASFIGLALLVGTARAALVPADIVWVVDTSGSMSPDIVQVKARIIDFNTAMVNAGIDAHYGLVEFGGVSGNGNTNNTAALFQDIVDFATFNMAGNPFSMLSAAGGLTEDGSLAIQTGMTATFRPGSVQNFIVVTDEDDDVVGNRAALITDLANSAANELINVIGNPNDDSNNFYQDLATNNGGQFFDILAFRADPDAFFTNFIDTKVQEIIDQSVPLPATVLLMGLGLVGLGLVRRRRTSV